MDGDKLQQIQNRLQAGQNQNPIQMASSTAAARLDPMMVIQRIRASENTVPTKFRKCLLSQLWPPPRRRHDCKEVIG